LWSKAWAVDNLSAPLPPLSTAPRCEPDATGAIGLQRTRKPPVVMIDDYLELRYAENCGAAFSLLRDAAPNIRRVVFGVATIVAAFTLIWMFLQSKKSTLLTVGLALIASGAVGNLVDRVRQEYVIDFIRFHIRNQWEWPTFNIADLAISIGVGVLLLDGVVQRFRAKAEEEAKEGG